MFAIIDLKGATKIAIFVPSTEASQGLNVILGFIERAYFIKTSFNEINLTVPELKFITGDSCSIGADYGESIALQLVDPNIPMPEGYEFATAGAFLSAEKALKERKSKIEELEKTIRRLTSDLEVSQERRETLANEVSELTEQVRCITTKYNELVAGETNIEDLKI